MKLIQNVFASTSPKLMKQVMRVTGRGRKRYSNIGFLEKKEKERNGKGRFRRLLRLSIDEFCEFQN